MEVISYLITIILTIFVTYIINKLFNKSYEHNKINNSKDDVKKNHNIEKFNNNDLNKENIRNIYKNEEEPNLIIENNKKIYNSEQILNNNDNNTIKEEIILYSSYNDKEIYGYLYQLPSINNRLIILDTEVAGISSLDHIIELSALEMKNGKLTSQYFHSFFNPKKRINPSILKKHKIPKSVFKYSYNKEKQIFENFLKFIDNSIIVAHNAVFDMEKISYELNYYNLPLIDKFQFRCSMRIFLDKYSHLSNKFSKLKECCDFLDIKYEKENLHLAYYDAFLVGKILEKIYTKENNNINNNENEINSNDKIKNEDENKVFDKKLKNIDSNYSNNAGSIEKTSFEKIVDENIDEIYKNLEDEETDKIIEKVFEEETKINSFNNFVDENIDDIFNSLKEDKVYKKNN